MSEQYEVGKSYWVRAARMISQGASAKWKCYYIAILGEPHSDTIFGVQATKVHLHIDARFMDMRKFNKHDYFIQKDGTTADAIFVDAVRQERRGRFDGIVMRKMKCVRLTTGLAVPNIDDEYIPPSTKYAYWSWVRSMVGKSCAGKKCPHRDQEMLECDGKWVCPLHGLTGDPATEKIISHEKIHLENGK